MATLRGVWYELRLAFSFACGSRHTHFEKNVTRNIALKSTTYERENVTKPKKRNEKT